MNRGTISMRYAKALMIYALRHGVRQRLYDDSSNLLHAYRHHPALKRVIRNKLLTINKKVEVITRCGGESLCNEFCNFIRLVFLQHREDLLQTICLDYMQLVRQAENIMEVDVTTASLLDKHTQALFENKLGQLTGKTVRLRTIVDHSIIGGYILRWDTYRIDRSVSGSLKRIEKSFLK